MKRMYAWPMLALSFLLLCSTQVFAQADAFATRYFLPNELELAECQAPWLIDEPLDTTWSVRADAPPAPGFLTISTDRSKDVHLFVNEQEIGTLVESSPSNFAVEPGTYAIQGRNAKGKCVWQTSVLIEPAQLAHLHIDGSHRGGNGYHIP
jgi:hypothetical protein